jgi:hypothetical protein
VLEFYGEIKMTFKKIVILIRSIEFMKCNGKETEAAEMRFLTSGARATLSKPKEY